MINDHVVTYRDIDGEIVDVLYYFFDGRMNKAIFKRLGDGGYVDAF